MGMLRTLLLLSLLAFQQSIPSYIDYGITGSQTTWVSGSARSSRCWLEQEFAEFSGARGVVAASEHERRESSDITSESSEQGSQPKANAVNSTESSDGRPKHVQFAEYMQVQQQSYLEQAHLEAVQCMSSKKNCIDNSSSYSRKHTNNNHNYTELHATMLLM
jgi:hypothetical protein